MSTAGRHTRVVTLARRPGPGGPAPEDFTLTERAVPELGAGQLLGGRAVQSRWVRKNARTSSTSSSGSSIAAKWPPRAISVQ